MRSSLVGIIRIGAVVALVATLAPPASAQAGGGRVRGRVSDAASQTGLADVQIVVIGAGVGAVTSANGAFLVDNVPAGRQRLRIRKIGFAPRDTVLEVGPGSEYTLNVSLREAPTALSEVVVTGTPLPQQRREVANAVEKIDVARVTANTNVGNVAEVLQSRAPGVTVLPGSGVPGTAADIRIRGSGSLAFTRPIIYVDGVRYNSGELGNFAPTGAGLAGQAQSSQSTSALDFLNPNDIESIEVIKGPAAATLYGADASAGVIQIITKKGIRGQQKLQWNARGDLGTSEWALEPYTNFTTCDSIKKADAATWPGCVGVPTSTVLKDNPLRRDKQALRVGTVQRTSLSARGGGDKYSYYISADRSAEQGVFYNSYSKTQGLRTNFNVTPTEKTDAQVSVSYIQGDLRLPYQDESANALLLSASRGRPGRVTASTVRPGWSTISPDRSNQYNNQTKSDRLTLGGTANWRPFGWLTNRVTGGLDYTTSLAQLLALPGSNDDPNGFTAQRVPRTRLYTLDAASSARFQLPWVGKSTTSIGAQVLASRTERLDATGLGLGAVDITLISSAITTTGSNTFSENNTVGYYLQQQLDVAERFILTGALRADDNSSFGERYDVVVYPKASFAYILSEEPALRGLFAGVGNDEFKLRTAWGRAGKAPSPYSATQTYTTSRVTLSPTQTVNGVTTFSYGNPGLRPEQGSEIETGFDATFFGQRLQVSTTYYDKVTSDLLQSRTVAPSFGFPGSIQLNLGRIRNSGVELTLGGTPIEGERFSWESRMNLSTNRNRLISLGEPGTTRAAISGQAYTTVQENRVGYPLGGYWVRMPLRDAQGNITLRITPRAAPSTIVDTAVVYDTTRSVLRFIGPSIPTREAGWSNTLTFARRLRLFTNLDYKGGHYLFNGKEWNRCVSNQNCQAMNDPRVSRAERFYLRQSESRGAYVEKADFIKLREVSLSYDVPGDFVRMLRGEKLTLSVAGRNLALWSGYTGMDPEVNTYSNATRTFARADLYAAPMMRRITFSANVNF